MSAINSPASGGGVIDGSAHPQPSKDGSQIIYSWLPHSTALGASSTVALRVRNASLSGVGRGDDDEDDLGWSQSLRPSSDHHPPCDEKKHDDCEGTSTMSSRPFSNVADVAVVVVGECRVEASVHAHGLPLQAAPVSTARSPLLVPRDDAIGGRLHSAVHRDLDVAAAFGGGKECAATATFESTLRLPVRWRDLTRDACLALNVFRDDGGTTTTDRGRVWGTTLPLFERNGRLRAGLYKLALHPDVPADGGMGYRSAAGGAPVESFLDGGATPGIIAPAAKNDGSCSGHSRAGSWADGGKWNDDDEEEDPEWEASLILHELDRLNSNAQPGGGGGTRAERERRAANPKPAPWLDALTRQRCEEILREGGGGDGIDRPPPPSPNATPAPASSRRDAPYLIVELPTAPVPILHEEPLYPPEAARPITACELIKYHSQFRGEEEGVEEEGGANNGLFPRISPAATEALVSATPRRLLRQSFLYPLVQALDPEPPLTAADDAAAADNPAQDKHRILAHDLLRGLVDPGLKPDGAQRGRLERVVGSPGHHLTTEEKDLLWRFRFSLVDNRRALAKFLLAVDWTVESEVVQAAELLEQWRKRSPIEVTDALKLLGRNVAFQTGLVRSYAIETLSDAPDEELRLYLLQLVQALKYEEDISGGGGEVAEAFSDAGGGGAKSAKAKKNRGSSLSAFLIERASRNIELANFLFWYLRVEMLNPIYEARYREVFTAFQKKLNLVLVRDGAVLPPGERLESLESESSSATASAATATATTGAISLWQLLVHQEKFISGIMECQRDALVVRGKKDAKEGHLRRALEEGGFRNIPHAVPLPSAPHVWVRGVECESAKMFKSALYPAVLDFIVDRAADSSSVDGKADGKGDGAKRAGTKPSTAEHRPSSRKGDRAMYKVMIKTGDDLRQDQLVIMMIQLMDRLLKRGTLDLCLRPYSILAMPNNTGLMEFVERSIPVSQILSGNQNSIMAFFQRVAPQEGARHGVKPDVLQTYVRSCAGYCVLTYLLGVGDRHLDNIMIQPSGHFFHIDFGFIFGRDPKPLPPAFRLTTEMVDGMGGTNSKEYRQFCSLACQAFNVLRKSAGLVLNLLHLMSDAGIEDLSHNPSADAIGVISKVEERFRLELSDEQAESFFVGLINESVAALAPRVMEMFHQLSVARR